MQDAIKDVFGPMLEAILQGEMDNHLGYASNDHGCKDTDNRRNGYIDKTVRSSFGEVPVSVPRDRDGSFEPQIIPKRSMDIIGIEDKVLSMYGRGMSQRDISSTIEDIYGFSLFTIQGDHGKLAAVLQTPDGEKEYPLVIVCHGFTSNKDTKLMQTLVNDLEKEGIATLRFDFNGHGKSEGRFQDMTVLNEIKDAKKVYSYAAKLPHVTSISFAGHSQGGVVASMTAGLLGTDKVKSLALMAPAAVLREDAIRGDCIKKGLTLGRNYVLAAQTLPIYETAVRYQGPAFMIHGTGDVIVPYTYRQRYHRIYFNGQLKLVPGEDHGFTHDTQGACQAVTDYFVAQLKK